MKTTRKSVKIVALMLFIVMSLSSLFGCAQLFEDILSSDKNNNSDTNTGVNDNVETPGDTTADGGNNTVNGDNGTHSHIFGDWTVIKNATNTEDGLQERKCDCGAVEQQTIPASNKEYTITYSNLKSADYPTVNGYNSSEGLLNLPVIESEGYRFIGWYTSSIGGNIVDYIPKGSTGDYVLFAHWELVNYEITYKNVPDNTNPTSYNIESSLKLTTPTWRGLEFTHWSDQNGNTYTPDQNITFMPKAITGDLVLTANWKVLRNIATQSNVDNLISAYSNKDGHIYMIFELGTIEHVVLDNIIPDMYYKYEGMPINLSLSQTLSISEETAQTVAKTVSQSVSSTTSYSYASNWATENSYSENGEISSSVSANAGFVSASVETSLGYESSNSNSWGSTIGKDNSSSSSSETSNSVSNYISYKKDLSSTVSEDITVSETLPSGYYAYVHAANIIVFGVVTYDIATGNFYLDTYSRLDNMHSMMMYYANVNQLNNPSVEGLDFNIPEAKILDYVNNFYYVNYDANGGEGTMPTTLHSVNGSEKLAKNQFTKEGCVFAGWELETKDGVSIFLDEQSVSNLAEPRQIVSLKAIWTSDPNLDVAFTAVTKSGHITEGVPGVAAELRYSAVIEYRNRTANKVEVRIIWTATLGHHYVNPYSQNFKFSVGSVSSGKVTVVAFNTWNSEKSYDRSCTAESPWVTVELNSSDATTIDLVIYYWQANSNGTDVSGALADNLSKTWTINIPAC